MRVKLGALAIAIALLLLLPSIGKADTYTYNVTSTIDNLDVTFDSPTLTESITTSTFTEDTSSIGPLTEFSISSDSTGCEASNSSFSVVYGSGPCMVGVSTTGVLTDDSIEQVVPGFNGTGTFISYVNSDGGITTTVTITDVSTATPEPSSLLLLGTGLLSIGLMACSGKNAAKLRRVRSSAFVAPF